MLITFASNKGGVAKTTSAVHLACFLQERGSTLLVDGDDNRSAIKWDGRGSLPFKVVDESEAEQATQYEHTVVDTAARPGSDDMAELAEVSDLIIIPSSPDAMALDGLLTTIDRLEPLKATYKVLLTLVPTNNKDGIEAQDYLKDEGIPVFESRIRRYVAYSKAALKGVPVYGSGDRNARIAWRDYQDFGKEVLGE